MKMSGLYMASLKNTPGRIAYICGESAVTYSELDEAARFFGKQLAALEIGRGDRVAVCAHNIPELPQFYFAIFRLGAIAVAISPYSTAAEIAYALQHSSARLLIAGQDIYTAACEAAGSSPLIEKVLSMEVMAGEMPGPGSLEGAGLQPEADLQPLDSAMILYTSGSTALPKGIVYTGKSLFAAASNRTETLGLETADIYFNAGYLCHGAAATMTLFPVLYSGGTALFMKTFSPDPFWPLVDKYHPTILALGPSQLWAVLEHPLCAAADISSLRYATAGGDVVGAGLHDLFLKTMGFPLSESIGMTECGTYMTTRPGMPHKPGSMGKPVVGAEVRLVNEDGIDVAGGETGQIIVRTESMMLEYWRDQENTAAAIMDGWLHTGDAAYRDEDGYYYFAGRIKTIIVRDSCNISPAEVENAIKQHPAVKDCGIAGIPDERHGQKVFAFIVVENGMTGPDDAGLEAFTADLVMGPRLPDHWVRLAGLPATALGKLDRKKLQQMALEKFRQ